MVWLRSTLSCLTFLVPLMGVVALRLDHAPSVLTAAAYLPVAALTVMTQWLITVKLREAPGTLEEFMLAALCFALAGIFGPYFGAKLGVWWGVGMSGYLLVVSWLARVAFTLVRAAARAHHLRTGTLGELVDTTFVHFLEFTAVAAYGTLSTAACLAAVGPDDSRDLLDATMWEECGPIALSNFCLGMLIVMVFLEKLAVVETGIADIHAIMTFDIPRGLKFIALNVALMGCITLYYQAATNFHMDLRAAFVLVGGYMFFCTNVTAASVVALPLKAVVEGTHLPAAIARQTTGQSLARSRSALGVDAGGRVTHGGASGD